MFRRIDRPALEAPKDRWELLDEWHGLTGIDPRPYSWWRYKRKVMGWKRGRWEQTGEIAAAVLNTSVRRADGRPWVAGDITEWVDGYPRYEPKTRLAERWMRGPKREKARKKNKEG